MQHYIWLHITRTERPTTVIIQLLTGLVSALVWAEPAAARKAEAIAGQQREALRSEK